MYLSDEGVGIGGSAACVHSPIGVVALGKQRNSLCVCVSDSQLSMWF